MYNFGRRRTLYIIAISTVEGYGNAAAAKCRLGSACSTAGTTLSKLKLRWTFLIEVFAVAIMGALGYVRFELAECIENSNLKAVHTAGKDDISQLRWPEHHRTQ